MPALAWPALRAVTCRTPLCSCKIVASRQSALPRKFFHTSKVRRRDDEPPKAWIVEVVPEVENLSSKEETTTPESEKATNGPDDGAGKPPKPKDSSNYGSAKARRFRNARPVELPRVNIPSWFVARNVGLWEENTAQGEKEQSTAQAEQQSGEETPTKGEPDPRPMVDQKEEAEIVGNDRKLNFIPAVESEVLHALKAGLQIPTAQNGDSVASVKPHLVLFCPNDGGTYRLRSFVEAFARNASIDILRLDPQDIAEVGGDYMEEPGSFRSDTLSSLGYDTSLAMSTPSSQPSEEDQAEEDEYEEAEEESSSYNNPPRDKPMTWARFINRNGVWHNIPPAGPVAGNLQGILQSLMKGSSNQSNPSINQGNPSMPKEFMINGGSQIKDNTADLKLSLFVEHLLETPEMKRASSTQRTPAPTKEDPTTSAKESTVLEPSIDANASPPEKAVERGNEGLIVLIEDYPQINTTINGGKVLDKLHEVVAVRRREGQKVLVVGTASSKQIMPSLSRASVDNIQEEPRDGPTRTIIMPLTDKAPEDILMQEQQRKIRETNLRHVRDMVRRIAPAPSQTGYLANSWDLRLTPKVAWAADLDEEVWSMDFVNRVATLALGSLHDAEEMTADHIEKALILLDQSDSAKYAWASQTRERSRKQSDQAANTPDQDSEARMRKLRKQCNSHEKKLLNGVVDPQSIRTTFGDVQAPPETIDALKTLTSLSLVRPDAFKYGVLATDRIPGLLLYGPPGTGKTLLAKAVAKESGATVLEVSGSDVYDMYVGEGEKNVRAIFTLAKKLTPCIIFIDEADAILGSRTGSSNRTSHRELINQFLREWDGMTDFASFIMVATNRPFDLDEASLRRLPRRLLVDLPVEKDREAILKIHLKDEILDTEVSLPHLASQTPFYSGSDLKNLAVAAALACVREEFDTAATHNASSENPEDRYQYPEKRTLQQRHFTKAMEEISASISEDMGSLSAIRKFDEKYGDRRGRRKKGGYGFRTVKEREGEGERSESDNARVRNQS